MTEPSPRPQNRQLLGRAFNYANNPLTLIGIVLTTVSGIALVVFMVATASGGLRNPYLGIFEFLVLPAFFILGLVLIPIGMWRRRRRLITEGVSLAERGRFPRLDFNDPQLRKIATVILLLTAVNAVIFGISSFKAVEVSESVEFCGTSCHTVMMPENSAYHESPHSRVKCVECHIGPGASWFVKAKVDGLRQVWKTTWNTYSKPVATPLHTLRPARETCEECHWPAKHYGDKVRIFARFASDEANTARYSAMVLKTGGGRLDLGRHGGIHWWHIYSDNKIRYVASDERREEISWVELTTPQGEVRTYTRGKETAPAPAEIEQEARVMDCIDCHNRPTHLFKVPSKALDEVLQARPPLAGLPFYKRQALAAVQTEYPTHAEGVAGVRKAIGDFYRESYPQVWAEKQALVEAGAEEAAQVYARSVFPEMKTNWETHPNHIGHDDFPGCWRCHDDELTTPDGAHTISIDCELCHTFPIEDSPEPPVLSAQVATEG